MKKLNMTIGKKILKLNKFKINKYHKIKIIFRKVQMVMFWIQKKQILNVIKYKKCKLKKNYLQPK